MPTSTTTYTYNDLDISSRTSPIGGESDIAHTRIFWRNDGAPIFAIDDTKLAVKEGVIPVPDQYYIAPGSVTTQTWEQFARFRSYNLEQVDKYRLRVQLRWSTLWCNDPTSGLTPEYALASSMEYSAQTRSMRLYRTGWTVAPSNVNTTLDIGGTSLAGQDGAISVQVPQVRIRMRFTQDAGDASMLNAATSLSSYVDKLNLNTFAGCNAGTLLCEGVNIGSAGNEFYEVVFDMLYDGFYHLTQVPTVEADGKAARAAGGELLEVKWKRVARSTTEFNNIYSADAKLKTRTETGWWL